jgi:hypothetical protein
MRIPQEVSAAVEKMCDVFEFYHYLWTVFAIELRCIEILKTYTCWQFPSCRFYWRIFPSSSWSTQIKGEGLTADEGNEEFLPVHRGAGFARCKDDASKDLTSPS